MNKTTSSGSRVFQISTLALIVILSGTVFYLFHSRPKLAFVRTMDLVYSYNGMRDAHNEFKAQSDAWQANIDTLKLQYQNCLANYQNSYKSLSESERRDKVELIKKLESNLNNYTSVIRQQSAEKEKSMTEGVLNQINSYVEEYSKKKGYDFVFGNNNSSILFGEKAYDITEDVLTALNKEYRVMPNATGNANEVKK